MKLEIAASLFFVLGPFVGAKDELDSVLSQRISSLRQKSRELHLPRKLSTSLGLETTQSFFLPFKEPALYEKTFTEINSGDHSHEVMSITSISISVSGTKVYYDHWEDGYEDDVMAPTQASTQIWGDADPSNGCRPDVSVCNAANDVFVAGDAIVLENEVPVNNYCGVRSCTQAVWDKHVTDEHGGTYSCGSRIEYKRDHDHLSEADACYFVYDEFPHDCLCGVETTILFDGGDNIQSSSPIAITRGAYPEDSGSYMAGAVEVFDTKLWGKSYKIPLDERTNDRGLDHFEYVEMYFMAAEDDTNIMDNNGATACTLDKGESCQVRMDTSSARERGDFFTSDKRFQANMLTGDEESTYELRWYSLRPFEDWGSEYLSPVGDTKAQTKIVVYNPNSNGMWVYYHTKYESWKWIWVEPNDVAWTETIRDGSGCILGNQNGKEFIAFSVSDTRYGNNEGGKHYDWGFPVIPTNMLTSTALIGWAYGCTANECHGGNSRSVVWITPYFEHGNSHYDIATVYVDYDNDGTVDDQHDVNYLSTLLVNPDDDPSHDQDLSGAVIYATRKGTTEPVRIAVAYGQKGSLSAPGDRKALDLGTVVVPFPPLAATKSWTISHDADHNHVVSIGDTVKYTIEVSNVGPVDIPEHLITVFDTLDNCLEYQPHTTYFIDENDNSQEISSATFPFTDGVNNPVALPQHELHKYTFEVKIGSHCPLHLPIVNTGVVKVWDQEAPFEKEFPLGKTPRDYDKPDLCPEF